MQRRRGRRNQAFTLVELCLAVGVVVVLMAVIALVTNATWGWGMDMHRRSGNVALADGSAHSSTDQRLRQLTARGANRLVIP